MEGIGVINTMLLFLDIGGGELLVILGAIFLLFGPKKMPELARGLGRAVSEFKKASSSIKDEINKTEKEVEEEFQEIIDMEKEKKKSNQNNSDELAG